MCVCVWGGGGWVEVGQSVHETALSFTNHLLCSQMLVAFRSKPPHVHTLGSDSLYH